MKMKHFLFTDNETGEDFIVGAETLDEARDIAEGIFETPEFIHQMSDFEAETSGLDEY